MPSPETFTIKPIADLLSRYLVGRTSIVDPFSRASKLAHYSNDLSKDFGGGLDAVEYLARLQDSGVRCDALLLDPPYSPRQMSECYQSVGMKLGMKQSQTAALYKACKDRMTEIATPDAIAITFGWSSVGFGLARGWEQVEILLVCHGGAHNDTICVVERRKEGKND